MSMKQTNASTEQLENKKSSISSKAFSTVAYRNARERKRVHKVNIGFDQLKNHLPNLRLRTRRVSKLKILRSAIEYINSLQEILFQEVLNKESAVYQSRAFIVPQDDSCLENVPLAHSDATPSATAENAFSVLRNDLTYPNPNYFYHYYEMGNCNYII
ncbi:Helix-loop-helix protein 4 [Trichinella pseudospiralis]|uniref:Helix-loop-helix protein 4 n=1 Tax=Trichinella pseudospiralis TaxID=6337 RepID=A0A0V0XEH3_TRIPS|nr:Helix-loop-helix protein 4 [Trichinella pseudospiralis]